MSFEEMVNVGGSEEVRALEYGDIEMTNESSDSERTEEGIGGSEMAEVKGEGVPATVLEVGGRNERWYDFEADIVSEVRKYESELGTRDSLGYLMETYEISSRVLIRPAGVEERACFAPRDHWMPMYAHYLAVGLWFPIPELLVGLLLNHSIGLIQLAPNAMRIIIGFLVYCRAKEAEKANQNKYSLNSDEEEEVGKLVREEGDIVNIMYLTSSDVIEAAKLYGPSSLSEAKMDKFLGAIGGVAVSKKPSKKSRTSTNELKRKGSKEPKALQKKKKVVEQGVRGDEVIEFVPRPPPIELDPKPTETEVGGAEVRTPGKRKGLIPPFSFQSSLFDVKNATGAKRFINATFPEVDKRQAKEEVLTYAGATVVKHALESASWMNALAQEFVKSVKERTILRGQCEQLQKEKDELEKKNKELQEMLDEMVPVVKQLEDEKDSLSTKLVFEERKRKTSKSEREAQEKEIKKMKEAMTELKKNVELLVHNATEEHIANFLKSGMFDEIVNLYRLPTAILTFTDCRKKVKSQYLEVDVTSITFDEQEEGAEENGESMSVDFRSKVKLRWDHDTQGRTIFPPHFDFKFVAVEEEVAEVEEEDQPAHLEVGHPSLPAEEEPPQPPLPTEE
ncbi:hypothetical protein SLEP1_g38396 [Rubroshorea leprosula]|nr:hypothetical protein SLEP1_g38396 [Rubroshorea leprosula]